MCGISLCIQGDDVSDEMLEALLRASEYGLSRRGPDAFRSVKVVGTARAGARGMHFSGGVLRIQGESLVSQPYSDEEGNLLLWNGEVFGSADGNLDARAYASDTVLVSHLLRRACSLAEGVEQDTAIVSALANIHGPFALIYFHANSGRVLYGRDPFGRRSLLRGRRVGAQGTEWLSSVSLVPVESAAGDTEIEEVSIGGIFVLSPTAAQGDILIPYPEARLILPRNKTFTRRDFSSEQEADEAALAASSTFLDLLRDAVQRRVQALSSSTAATAQLAANSSARVGVLFSGGIDSVLIAAQLHFCLNDPAEPIDLINVTFFGETAASGSVDLAPSPDRLASISALVELETLYPTRRWNLIHVDVPSEERVLAEERIRRVILPCDTHMDLNIGTAFWFASRAAGYSRGYTRDDKHAALQTEVGGRPLLRIGGEGAARGTGRKYQPGSAAAVEGESGGATTCGNEACRLPAKRGCPHLFCAKCCHKTQRIARSENSGTDIIAQSCTVHKRRHASAESAAVEQQGPSEQQDDDSEAALELLSLFSPGELRECTSRCRALLVGIGADEQMAGYGRHRTTFQRGGEAALARELDMDLDRLHSRNLGRDDRCMSDHGREAWFPYLDEGVVAFLHSLSLREIADLREPSGKGDKQILRRAAASLGLGSCTELVKRAVQFGTRIAKHTNIRELGSNRKGKGDTKI